MSAEFVPFAPAVRTRAANPSPAAMEFAPVAAGAPKTANHREHEPKVEVKRSGDRITEIQITCSCGETIQIACDY